MTDTHLALSWSVSRGRETYGYNIARLDDTSTGKRYRCMGGGYDMTGTVLAQWLCDVYQDRLQEIATWAGSRYWRDETNGPITSRDHNPQRDTHYSMSAYYVGDDLESVHIDGACGTSAVESIMKAIDLSCRHLVTRRGHLTGYIVTDTREATS